MAGEIMGKLVVEISVENITIDEAASTFSTIQNKLAPVVNAVIDSYSFVG